MTSRTLHVAFSGATLAIAVGFTLVAQPAHATDWHGVNTIVDGNGVGGWGQTAAAQTRTRDAVSGSAWADLSNGTLKAIVTTTPTAIRGSANTAARPRRSPGTP